ncbi:MAG: LPS export ABC transporter permease LptG [Gammaproteobacteria bacterium]|nr:LPS export ABC transporter permease LptG [Gammaproteobacteria bacterium]
MKLAENYIAKTVFASMALVILMLIGLQAFILFVNQLGDLGKGDFHVFQALAFVGLSMPYEVYLFFPMASLLGCLIGLGVMANHSELVILRAAGMSISQITHAILKMAMILIVAMTLLGELLLPKLVLWANDYKSQMLSGGRSLQTTQGLWLRADHDIIMITTVHPPNVLEKVEQFHFDDNEHLLFVRHIQRVAQKDGSWWATGVVQTNLWLQKTSTSQVQEMPWDVALDPRVLRVSRHEPDEMTFPELHRFIRAQQLAHQNIQNYRLGYWQRIIMPLTTVVMMLLAIPFIFGPLRSSTMGSKLMVGAFIGFGFYILNRFCGSLSQIYQFSTVLAAIGPTLLCAGLGLYLMRRAK